MFKTQSFLEKSKLSEGIRGKTIIVQGFGNVGFWAAKFFRNAGAKVIGIVERDAAIFCPNGLDVDEAKAYYTANGTLKGFSKAYEEETLEPEKCMERPCDILIPAATEKSIHVKNADKLQCKVVVEGANGPTTFKAEEILLKKGIIVCPDMLFNVGGVTVSYFEWLKNMDHVAPGRLTKKYEEKKNITLIEALGYKFPTHSPQYKKLEGAREIDIVYSGLEEVMTSAVQEHWKFALDNDLCFRDACLVKAIQKIYKHYEQAGLML